MTRKRSSRENEASLVPNANPGHDVVTTKRCAYCSLLKPLAEFKRRTGKRRGAASRRGSCKACRDKQKEQADTGQEIVKTPPSGENSLDTVIEPETTTSTQAKKKRRRRRSMTKKVDRSAVSVTPIDVDKEHPSAPKASLRELRAIGLIPTRKGFIRMRGKSDNGRRWYQEVDPELAMILVKERAAVVVNRQTIRRLYSNKEFRTLILERDQYTCRFCGQYGDTIDHMLPRAKGGHTTPDNCVCACSECNQSKADKDIDEFISHRHSD